MPTHGKHVFVQQVNTDITSADVMEATTQAGLFRAPNCNYSHLHSLAER